MTRERAHIKEARVRQLANGIIETQKREIGEMKSMTVGRKSIRLATHIRPAAKQMSPQ